MDLGALKAPVVIFDVTLHDSARKFLIVPAGNLLAYNELSGIPPDLICIAVTSFCLFTEAL